MSDSTSVERRSVAAAVERVMTLPAVDLVDLALVTGVSVATIQRHAGKGELPVPASRIGQRWVIPSAPVRALLHLDSDADRATSA